MIAFSPGVFRLDDAANTINRLCIPSHGAWVQPGGAACLLPPGASVPPGTMRYQMGSPPAAGVSWILANLGVDEAQWAAAPRAGGDLGMIGRAVRLYAVPGPPPAVEYDFNSAALPPQLDAEVPGGGIYMHMQDLLPNKPETYPFAQPDEALQVEANLALPVLRITGGATDGITVGLSFQAPDSSGHLAPVSLLVSLFNSKGFYREHVSTDGRNIYAASSLTGASTFLKALTAKQLVPGASAQTFVFQITAASMTLLLNALNVYREQRGELPLAGDLSLVRLHQVDLRNENGRLDEGTATLTLRAGFLRASLVAN